MLNHLLLLSHLRHIHHGLLTLKLVQWLLLRQRLRLGLSHLIHLEHLLVINIYHLGLNLNNIVILLEIHIILHSLHLKYILFDINLLMHIIILHYCILLVLLNEIWLILWILYLILNHIHIIHLNTFLHFTLVLTPSKLVLYRLLNFLIWILLNKIWLLHIECLRLLLLLLSIC